MIDNGLCACSQSGLAMLALTRVHKPTRRHFTFTKFGERRNQFSHQQGAAVDSRSFPGVRIRKPKPLCNRSYFSREHRQATSASLAPEALKHVLKADLFLQGVVDSAGAAFLVWDGISGVQDATLLEHEGRSAS